MYDVHVCECAGYPAYVQHWRKYTGCVGERRAGWDGAGWLGSFQLVFYCAFINRQRAFLFERYFEPGLRLAFLETGKRK